ncbi:AfsR/SARP family transcriptional regulator [Pseudothermotoga sp. U03pept]|uniref:AfsR/SARP family transcriptional regulator n=1 Tax=Pseudothermotoga sp. U03pept TaxID=3447012 RepID=UPI003F0B33E7
MLSITTFGVFTVASDGEKIDLSKIKSRKARDLLRYFVVFRRKYIPSDILCEIFWQDMDEKYAKMNLQSTVHMLRKSLGKDKIAFQNGSYCFDPCDVVEIDADKFETLIRSARSTQDKSQKKKFLEDAIMLYKGEFLLEDLYQDWSTQSREYYKDLHVQTLIELAQILIEEDSTDRAIEILRTALYDDPFEERAVFNLMRAYARKGCSSEAIKTYLRFSEMLNKELQIKPSKELVQFYESILRGDLEDKWLIIVEGPSCSSKRELVIQELERLVRERDEIQVLSMDKIGILINDVAQQVADNIYQRVKGSLDGNLTDVKVYLRKAR